MTKFYGNIEKTEKQADGTIIVMGYASSEATDSDGEIIKAEAISAAIPDFMKFANVREMHQAKAAGNVLEMVVQDDGRTFVKTHIVGTEACKLVENKVYKGFSVGGRVTSRDENDQKIIKGIRLSEISLVDRPANPEAVFTFCKIDDADKDDAAKRDFSAKERQEAADKGEAMPDGSFPIKNKEDLENAIKAFGRAKDPAKAKAHIKARAKALGAESSLPTTWKKVEGTDNLKKGMYGVANLARVLSDVQCLLTSAEYEEAAEGDDSEIPAALKSWLKQGGEVLKEMVIEEVEEMVGEEDEDDVEMAERATTLIKAAWSAEDVAKFEKFASKKRGYVQKAGARNSKADQEKLDNIHKMAGQIQDHAEAMGANTGYVADGEKGAGKNDDVQKAARVALEEMKAINKALGLPETGEMPLAKVKELVDQHKEAVEVSEALAKRVKELEELPAPPKAALRLVEKNGEVATPESVNKSAAASATDNVKKVEGIDEAKKVLKGIYATGGIRE